MMVIIVCILRLLKNFNITINGLNIAKTTFQVTKGFYLLILLD